MLQRGLIQREYNQSKVDPYLFYKKDSIIVTYLDDCIIFTKDYTKVQHIIKVLEDNFKLTDEGNLSTYLGIDIVRNNDSTWTLLQPYLINRILKSLYLKSDGEVHDTLATEILTSDKNGEPFNKN